MSLDYLYGHPAVGEFVAAHIPHARGRGFGPGAAMMTLGVLRGDELIGGLIYHNWDPVAGTIEISGAATDPKWLTRETIRRMHAYPFEACGCQMVYMRVPTDNDRLLRQLAIVGYRFTVLQRIFGRARNGIVAQLMVEDWQEGRLLARCRGPLQQEAT